MSVSLKDSNARLFHNDTVTTDYSLRNTRFQMASATVGPTSLLSVGEHTQGLQKWGTVAENNKPRCDVASVEYVNNPPNLIEWAIGEDTGDFYDTHLATSSGGYGSTYCSANCNQYFNRRNASRAEPIQLNFRLSGSGKGMSSEAAFVVVTYETRDKRSASTVVLSQKIGGVYSREISELIYLPANNQPWVVVSVQNTAGPTGSGSTTYQMAYSRFECTYEY